MKKLTDKPEILAPAGSVDSLKAAVLSGADAVYFGVGNFNARRNAENFTREQIENAIEYCHSRGVKVHITLNTLIKDCELSEVTKTVETICLAGADAVIVQDLGVAKLVREICRDIELHASTQMSVGTLDGLYLLKSLGFSRAVLPRELNFDEIKYLCEHSPIDLEIFVHGALCMCVSGQCLMSAVLGSRSGNRGLCAQPCRLPFKAENGTGHDLSLKDLSLIDNIPELHKMGICSFKIEGRMKRPEYVSAAVIACKKVAEGKYSYNDEKDLRDLFSRSGFTAGYYNSHLGRDMFGYREKENVQSATKELFEKYGAVFEKEKPRFDVEFEFDGKIGKNAILTAICLEHRVTVSSETICEAPVNRPVSAERIIASLSKCGGTQFNCTDVSIKKEIDYSLPVSAVNQMRRTALELLVKEISGENCRQINSAPVPTNVKSENARRIYCRFDSINQIPENTKADMIFVPLGTEKDGLQVEIPHGMFGNSEKVQEMLRKSSAEYCLCHTLDAVAAAQKHGKKVVASPSLNIFNSLSMDVASALHIDEVIVSNECTVEGFCKISAPVSKGITVYGRLPLMLTRNCPVKNGKTCAECKRQSGITDRMGIFFPVRCNMGFSEILNSRPVYMGDRLREIRECDILFFNFTTESKFEVESVLNAYKIGEKPTADFTRGLLYRGVE